MGSTLSIPSLTGHLLMILGNLDHVISCPVRLKALQLQFCLSPSVTMSGVMAAVPSVATLRTTGVQPAVHTGVATQVAAPSSEPWFNHVSWLWLFHQGIDLLAPGFQTWDINMFHHVPSCKMMIKTRCPPLAQFYGAMASEGPIGTSSQIGQWLVSVCHTTHIVYAYNI